MRAVRSCQDLTTTELQRLLLPRYPDVGRWSRQRMCATLQRAATTGPAAYARPSTAAGTGSRIRPRTAPVAAGREEDDPLARAVSDASIPLAGMKSIPVVTNYRDLFSGETKLGSGGFGTTYRVVSSANGRTYALKILHQADPEILEWESAALQRLSSAPACRPHVACYRGAVAFPYSSLPALLRPERRGEQQQQRGAAREPPRRGLVFAVLSDFVPGTGLGEIADGRPERCEALRLLRGLLDAVAVVHEAGFAHRDIKPDNAIVTADGEVVLIDFGLACEQGVGGPQLPYVCNPDAATAGTEGYLAPELMEGIVSGDPVEAYQAGDMYALGVTALDLFGDDVWYENSAVGELVREMASEDPRARPTVFEAVAFLEEAEPYCAGGESATDS